MMEGVTMKVIHSYVLPKKRKDADCATCLFSEVTRSIEGEDVLLCKERVYDPKTLKCYLPKEGADNENP